MNDPHASHRGSVTRLHPVTTPPADENTASMIDLLQEHLRLAREGKLRSLAVVSVSSDGSAIGTQWSCDPGDMASLIGKLTVLTHDLRPLASKGEVPQHQVTEGEEPRRLH